MSAAPDEIGTDLDRTMARLAGGDRAAFRPVFDAAWPAIRRFVGRALGDAPDADDVAQQALMKIFSRASEYDPARPALAWMIAIASYEVRTFAKKRARRREVALEGGAVTSASLPVIAPTAESAAVERDLEAALADVLETMRPGDRDTLRAALNGGRHDGAEASAGPGAGATFRKRLERALARLGVAWRARHHDAD